MSVLVVGEALVDRVTDAAGTVADHPGGSPANVALGLERLGTEAMLVTALGDDAAGQLVRAHLESAGVRVLDASGAAPTSIAHATLGADGGATYAFDIEWGIVTEGLDVGAPTAIHTGSIGAFMAPGASAVAALVDRLRGTATVTYDPNVRPSLMPDHAEAVAAVERMVALSDVVKVSDEDLEWLYPVTSADAVAAAWAGTGPAYVIVTRGGDGATLTAADGRTLAVPAPRITVVDTVGAGDSFMAGLIDGLGREAALGGDRGALAGLTDAQLTSILERCIRIAAITCSRAGANPPTAAELDS